jgi:Cdc6-like AAA superfamily ATPase
LEKEQEQSVVYGSTDFGKTCTTNDKYKELVNKKYISYINNY